MVRLLRLALIAGAAAVSSGSVAAQPEMSLIDRFNAGRACEIHRAQADLIWLKTVGSVEGVRHEELADELFTTLGALQEMIEDTGSARDDILELRVTTTSDGHRRDVSRLIADTPELSGLPFTYGVAEGFAVSWARVGVDAVLRNSTADNVIQARYGSNVGPDCR